MTMTGMTHLPHRQLRLSAQNLSRPKMTTSQQLHLLRPLLHRHLPLPKWLTQ